MKPSPVPAWVPALVPFIFVGMWVSVSFLLAATGGWRALARRYPAPRGVSGTSFLWCSAQLGWVNYRGCLNLHAGPSGLRVSVSLPFRIGHRPFLVPWTDVGTERVPGFFFSAIRLQFREVPEYELELSERLATKIAAASQGALRLPAAS